MIRYLAVFMLLFWLDFIVTYLAVVHSNVRELNPLYPNVLLMGAAKSWATAIVFGIVAHLNPTIITTTLRILCYLYAAILLWNLAQIYA